MRKPRLGTVLLTLWAMLLTLFVYAYIAWLQPSRLGDTVSRGLESVLGVHCNMGKLSLDLFPMPTVTIDDLSIHRGSVDSLEFHARRASIQVSWFSMLRMKPIVRFVTLDSPTLDISGAIMQKALSSPSGRSAPLASFPMPDIPRYITGLRIDVRNGACRFASADGRDSLNLDGITIHARVPSIVPGRLDLSVDSLRYRLSSGLDLSVQDTNIAATSLFKNLTGEWSGEANIRTSLQLGSLDEVMGRRISDPYRYFPMPKPLSFSLKGKFTASPAEGLYSAKGKASVRAVLPMNGCDVPISLDVPFASSDLRAGIDLTDADARMGDDRLIISGLLFGLPEGQPSLYGKADIRHFSLTRWFGFGRLMDPGLQKALDNITGTFHEFKLTPYGVVVPRLTAFVEDIELHGSGSCTEFLKPVVRIDAHAKKADLNRIFTELQGHIPDMSYLPPPVLPITEDDSKTSPESDAITVGYDIHISADDAKIMNFRVGGADVHVIPAPDYGTMLTVDVSDVYGGKADAEVYIQDKIRVVADLDDVSLGGPSAALAGYPVLTGSLKKALMDIDFEPGNGIEMLTTLGGSVDAVMKSGAITVKGSSPLPYKDFLVEAKARATSGKRSETMPPTVDFTGSWNVSFDAEKWSASADTPKAVLAFSTKYGLPCVIREQSIPFTLTLKKALCSRFTRDIAFSVKGLSSLDIEKGTYSLKNGIAENKAFRLSGHAQFRDIFSSPAASGKAFLKVGDLKQAVSAFSLSLPVPDDRNTFGLSSAEADFSVNSRKLELKKLNGLVDDTSFSGRLLCDWTSRFRLEGELSTPSLDLDFYLPSTEAPRDHNAPGTPLPLDLLKDVDLRLDLTAGELRVLSSPFHNVSFPVTQKDGMLTVPIRTSFPGSGLAVADFKAALSEDKTHANISLQGRAAQIDMMALSLGRGQKTLISGLGSGDVSLLSVQRTWDDWRRTLDGFFSFFVSNGAIISPPSPQSHAETQPRQSRTNFNMMSMSGTVHDGIVSCKDFRITDSMLKVEGGGTVNLDKETIDAKATITVAGIPEMPVTLTGDLFSPETNYKLLGAVTGTVGNLGATLIDIVGGVITAPFKLLTGQKPF